MRNKKSPWILLILVMFGSLIGGIAGEFLARFPYLYWMDFGGVNGYRDLFSISMDPAFDIRILRFGFDVALRVNAGSILGIVLAVFVFIRI